MEELKSFIASGILESYVLGNSTQLENDLVEELSHKFKEVREEIDSISEAIELYALVHSVNPDPMVKTFLMATINFQERIKNGEQPGFPPELTEHSVIDDYSEWLNRQDMILPEVFDDLHARIIGYTPKVITAIVWIKEMSSPEVHDNEFERFLIVEGTCNITVNDSVYTFAPGDYFAIPLHKNHQVIVTSDIPCKVILQRIAA